MNKYYFTFTASHRKGKFVQPIYATSRDEAIEEMQGVYGKRFTKCFTEIHTTECEFDQNLIELRPLYTRDIMTFGEMRQLTERFNQIIGAGQSFKIKRLDKFADDIDNGFDINKDRYAFRMYLASMEAVAN